MSNPEPTADPQGATATPASQPPAKHHNRWKWISAALAVVAAGLLVWAVTAQSDLDDLQAQADKNKATGSAVVAEAEDLHQDIGDQLGSVTEDLADTARELADTQDDLADTEQDLAEAEQTTAEIEAAQSKSAIAVGCAKAYIAAFGGLFEGDSVETQAPAVRAELESISARCKSELAGT